MSSYYTHQIARADGLTISQACFCRLCYLMSSSLCALPQYMCVLLHMVPDTRDSTADNHSSFSAVFSSRRSLCFFSLRRGDLIRRCCRSVRRSVLNFVIFQKVRFREEYSNLSNTTKLTLLESLPQEI